MKKLGAELARNIQHVDRPVRSDLQGLRSEPCIIRRTRGRSEIEHAINAACLDRLAKIMLNQAEPRLVLQSRQVRRISRRIIVETDNDPAIRKKSLTKMRAQKSGRTAHQCTFLSHAILLYRFFTVFALVAGWGRPT